MKTIEESKIQIKALPERNLAYIRHIGPYKGDTELFGRLFGEVYAWAGPKGVLARPEMEAITVYHDPHTVPEEEQRISVGVTVPENIMAEGNMKILKLPKANYLVGSFEILPTEYGMAWESMLDHINEENLEYTGMMYESYQNEPDKHPEGKHIVEICIALKD
ncbi:AraC family transcriptional regulator [Poritiphilus flavus]|uniref:AraC effector-binding domain-containing protein n=1 Tax=Poritiphilus flavus TaxID=2697053 RepID=A0A6L9EC16_9FLAO|nr:GyrI-like domain-containing protein [Poritiphilus flavus]NAS12265.1 hypothetical protein [Poritiphilus flavus]